MFQQTKRLRGDAAEYQEVIKRAIEKLESEEPLKEWTPRQLQKMLERSALNNVIRKVHTYRTLLSYLKKLCKDGYLLKNENEKGKYQSKEAEFWRKTIQASPPAHEISEFRPQLSSAKFNEILQRRMPTILDRRRKYEKNFFSLIWNYGKWKDMVAWQNAVEPYIRERIREVLDLIKKSTTITIFSVKQPDYLDIFMEKFRETLTEMLFDIVTLERFRAFRQILSQEDEKNLAVPVEKQKAWLAKEEKVLQDHMLLQTLGLSIHINFSPGKIGNDISKEDFARASRDTYGCALASIMNPTLNIVHSKDVDQWKVTIRCANPSNIQKNTKKYVAKQVKKLGCRRRCSCMISHDEVARIISRIDIVGSTNAILFGS